MFKIVENIKSLSVNSMEKWMVMLCLGNSELCVVEIKWGIFQRDSLSSLDSWSEKRLDSLIQTIRVFSEDIGMEFGTEKCAILVMEKGKIVRSVGIELPDGKVINSLQEGES